MPWEGATPVASRLRPVEAFELLRPYRAPFFLDASGAVENPGGTPFSILGADPEILIEEDRDHFEALAGLAGSGGIAVGYLSYDAGRLIEGIPANATGDEPFPRMRFGLYRRVLLWDPGASRWLAWGDASEPAWWGPFREGELVSPPRAAPARYRLGSWAAGLSKGAYLAAVERTKAYIRDGDIYQANLSYRLQADFHGDPWRWYLALRAVHPVPYGAYLESEEGAILCLSPECLLFREGDSIRTFPIKGTRPRSKDPAEDLKLQEELEASAKERSELAMIVDLERNDLGRVCRAGSVRVESARRLMRLATVHHAVAEVSGSLRPGVDWAAILRATFPGGSITGCPKIRAMEILAELEPCARGVYTGSIGWLTRNAGCLNIAIRTARVAAGLALLNVGGAVTWDSTPELEYEETLHKGRAFWGRGAIALTAPPTCL